MGAQKTIPDRLLVPTGQFLIRIYQIVLSPFMGRQCRFLPTCSCYAHEALGKHGIKALPMIANRLWRCSPLVTSNTIQHDPVPEKNHP